MNYKLTENVVNELFAVPAETINLTCELKDEIETNKSLRILPEDDGNRTGRDCSLQRYC